MNKFRLVIAGGRDFNDARLMGMAADHLLSEKIKTHSITIVSGMARGADRCGLDYAQKREYVVDQYPANWAVHGRSAGYKRNAEMAKNCDAVLVFWDGFSSGTKHMIDISKKAGLPLRVVRYV